MSSLNGILFSKASWNSREYYGSIFTILITAQIPFNCFNGSHSPTISCNKSMPKTQHSTFIFIISACRGSLLYTYITIGIFWAGMGAPDIPLTQFSGLISLTYTSLLTMVTCDPVSTKNLARNSFPSHLPARRMYGLFSPVCLGGSEIASLLDW